LKVSVTDVCNVFAHGASECFATYTLKKFLWMTVLESNVG
jgi:hypothetical protein